MIRHLPHETIRAEIDLFATMPQFERMWYVIGGLADESDQLASLDTPPEEVKYGHARLDEHDTLERAEYIQAVRKMRRMPYMRQAIAVAANARQIYADCSPSVDELLSNVDSDPSAIPSLGSGESSKVYPVTVGDDIYALHTFRAQPLSEFGMFDMGEIYGSRTRFLAYSTAQKAAALALGDDIPGLTRLHSYSTEEATCLSTLAAGKALTGMTPDNARHVTPDQIDAYLGTLQAMHKRGLEIDPNPGNVFWHQEQGFTVIDCQRSMHPGEFTGKALGVIAAALMATNVSYFEEELRVSRIKMKSATPLLEHIKQRAEQMRTYVDLGEDNATLEEVFYAKVGW